MVYKARSRCSICTYPRTYGVTGFGQPLFRSRSSARVKPPLSPSRAKVVSQLTKRSAFFGDQYIRKGCETTPWRSLSKSVVLSPLQSMLMASWTSFQEPAVVTLSPLSRRL